MSLPVLTYFSSRGRAEMIRVLCAYAGIAYEERSLGVYHPVDKTPAFLALRATGVLPFDAVPLWEEPDGFRLAESTAIVRHLARTRGLYGKDAREAARCDMIVAAADDIRIDLRRVLDLSPADRAAHRKALAETILPRRLAHFEKLLGEAPFLVGDAPTFADLTLYVMSENLGDNGYAAAYAAAPHLAAHAARLAERPGLARYLASPSRFPAQILPT
jgi:glutathione S-transferase